MSLAGAAVKILKTVLEFKFSFPGGLKVWECTLDLLSYMEKESIHFEGKEVLDLGCGAGLLGIHSLNHGSSSTHFQDYVYSFFI